MIERAGRAIRPSDFDGKFWKGKIRTRSTRGSASGGCPSPIKPRRRAVWVRGPEASVNRRPQWLERIRARPVS